ncbi:hypothetical protein BLFGPEAP_00716 [Candidatus Methanoperedenaceae archaeon GB50]|nr:hypothetical protein BLFGPEAP_00716 [Candidatus Methanoperedenaceae archaeon GB50]CAD7773505.1 hypothetical protein DMNBHIDG_00773 [Candidatus Methanoperedenaceae archaeon GB37]
MNVNKDKPIIIDPLLASTFIDGSGDVYVTGLLTILEDKVTVLKP